jgi:ankyrin repeat protein
LLSPGSSQKQGNGLPTGGNLHPTSGSKGKLTPKKSLFDLLTTSDSSASGTNPANAPSSSGAVNAPPGTAPGSQTNNNAYEVISSQNMYSPAVPAKPAVDEKTFMDLDDDDDSDNEEKKKPIITSTASAKSSPVKNKPVEETKPAKQMTTSLSQQQQDVSYAASQQQKQQEALQENKEIVIETNANADHDLPAPHIAAANNQLSKLQIYYNLDDELLFSLDNVSRQPIFYAAANGHIEILKYYSTLCQHNPSKLLDILYHVDSYGDCLLHAVSSSGNVDCVQFLLDKEYELLNSKFVTTKQASSSSIHLGEPQPSKLVTMRNSTGMTATHLAHDDNVLSVLAAYGSNMNAKDYYQRTPLFIACAMNKASCVEYFIANCLDINEETENILLIKDYRGDTPLHAAACNNSVESLLQLLQCGIDPRLMNQQGLKAIDLAIRNKHFKCQHILAEYYLHYCTSSEFDSVLFLAALEVSIMMYATIRK